MIHVVLKQLYVSEILFVRYQKKIFRSLCAGPSARKRLQERIQMQLRCNREIFHVHVRVAYYTRVMCIEVQYVVLSSCAALVHAICSIIIITVGTKTFPRRQFTVGIKLKKKNTPLCT